MTRRQINLRISDVTEKQIDDLRELGYSLTGAVTVAIDRMWHQECRKGRTMRGFEASGRNGTYLELEDGRMADTVSGDDTEQLEELRSLITEHVTEPLLSNWSLHEVERYVGADSPFNRIRFVFDQDSVFGNGDPEGDGYDVQASLAAYAEELEANLSEEYPNTETDVSLGDAYRIAVDGMTDHEEIPWIEQLIDRVWNSGAWAVATQD
jgi:hypothetical protein